MNERDEQIDALVKRHRAIARREAFEEACRAVCSECRKLYDAERGVFSSSPPMPLVFGLSPQSIDHKSWHHKSDVHSGWRSCDARMIRRLMESAPEEEK